MPTWTFTDDEGREVEVTYTASRYVPARVSGPPENCYPAEGGLEDWSAECDGVEYELTEAQIDALQEQIIGEQESLYADAMELRAELRAEMRRDDPEWD